MNRSYSYQAMSHDQPEYMIKALRDLDTAIELDKYNANAYFNKGFLMNILEKPKDALIALEQNLNLQPLNSLAYFEKAKAYLKMLNLYNASLNINLALKYAEVN